MQDDQDISDRRRPDAASPPESGPPRPQAAGDPMLIYWKVLAWAAIIAGFGVLLWLLSPMLLPFVIAFVLAYFLDPPVRALTGRGLPRVAAALVVSVVTFGTLIGLIGLAVPFAIAEGRALIEALPESWEDAEAIAETHLPGEVADQIGDVREVAQMGLEGFRDNLRDTMGNLAQGVSGLISVVLFWVVMPVVTVYLLIDWPRLIATVDRHLPRPAAPDMRRLAVEIDATLSGYIRGQALVCAILIVYYVAALTAVGLPFSIAVGVITGAISFIPYIGMFIGTALGMGVAVWQFWGDPVWIFAVAAIYALGIFSETEILVPRLVGEAINLHPVWLIFAVIAFGTLFGFVGALVAVPLAAVAGVLARYGAARYRESTLYHGSPGGQAPPE